MSDGFTISIDAREVLAMFDRVGASIDWHARDVARLTAIKITAEAQARERRAVSDKATGVTESGIHWELTKDGKGYLVMAYRVGNQSAPVDIYLEHGTKFMRPRPFFFSSAELESEAHIRRLRERLQQVLDDLGR